MTEPVDGVWVAQPGESDTWRGHNVCPWCLTEHDAASGIRRQDEKKAPAEGDCSICWECGRVATFDAQGVRQRPTQRQLDTFLGDPGVQVALAIWSLLRGGRYVPPADGGSAPRGAVL